MSDEWKKLPPQRYSEVTSQLVHFNSKTVNSNAQLVGIRLAGDAALDLPYLSLRTLLAENVTVPLDYAEGGAAVAGIVKQINLLLRGDPAAEHAGEDEKAAISSGLDTAKKTAYSIGTKGTEPVDHRLRQLLIPKSDNENDYVSVTPMTANGLCALLFDGESGVVTQHNNKAEKSPDGTLKKLRQAQFGIGGSNPQNIGSLVRAMQHPLMLGAPRPPAELKKAFALYHSGLRFSVYRRSAFQSAVKKYVEYREKVLKPERTITLREREREARLVAAIAAAVLAAGAEAQHTLRQFARELPREAQLPDTDPPEFALVSPHLPFEMRALLDSRLRNKEWPRKMAAQTVLWMLAPQGREQKRLLLLDGSARASIENMLEDNFR